MTDYWKDIYTLDNSINSTIYNDLLAPLSDTEWTSTIKALPNGKAMEPSGISYEMLKHIGEAASNYLRSIVASCFETSLIPNQWKYAHIYPIPKPHDWDCYLKFEILKENNFVDLSGGTFKISEFNNSYNSYNTFLSCSNTCFRIYYS